MLNILQLKALVYFQALWWRSGGLLMWCVLDIGLFEGQLSVRPQSGFHLQHQCVENECAVAFSLSVTAQTHVFCCTVCPSGTALQWLQKVQYFHGPLSIKYLEQYKNHLFIICKGIRFQFTAVSPPCSSTPGIPFLVP